METCGRAIIWQKFSGTISSQRKASKNGVEIHAQTIEKIMQAVFFVENNGKKWGEEAWLIYSQPNRQTMDTLIPPLHDVNMCTSNVQIQ